jgi:putative membrane protein
MNRLAFLVLTVLAAAVGLLLGTLNSDSVTLDLLWLQLDWPLGLLLLLAMALGLLLGLLVSWFVQVLPLRMQLRKSRASAQRASSREVTGVDG